MTSPTLQARKQFIRNIKNIEINPKSRTVTFLKNSNQINEFT